MDFLFREWTASLASYIEAVAAIIIGIAAIESVARTALLVVRPQIGGDRGKEAVRLRLGRWLSVALEFELAADILRTAITPTWDDLGKLAAIVVIRTVINIFLQREIDKAAESGTASAAAIDAGPVARHPA